jgi:D-alanyl-D-alanine carboxypeptidase (penicillin-binding protein 5/6)
MRKNLRRDHSKMPFRYVVLSLCVLVIAKISTSLHSGLENPKIVSPSIEVVRTTFSQQPFTSLQITGKAYIVFDATTGQVIAEKNSTVELPLASLTKVMTLISALLHHNRVSPIVIDAKTVDGGLDLGLKNNQEWSMDELLKYTLVFSSNDGAMAIAATFGGEKTFTDAMTGDSAALGFPMQFTHAAGLDENNLYGGFGSALHVAMMLAYAHAHYPDIIEATTKTRVSVRSEQGVISGVPNTNQDIDRITEALASKTGYTDSAGGNLAVLFDLSLGHPIAIVVLGSTREERFKDIRKLYSATKSSWITSPGN